MSQNVSSKPIMCQRSHQMLLIICLPNLYHASVYTIFICWPNQSTESEDKMHLNTLWTHHMLASTQKVSQHVFSMPARTKNSTQSVRKVPLMPARTQNSFQHMLTKHIPCQVAHKMHNKMFWLNASQHILTKAIQCSSTYVDQTHPLPANHEMQLNMCWPNP